MTTVETFAIGTKVYFEEGGLWGNTSGTAVINHCDDDFTNGIRNVLYTAEVLTCDDDSLVVGGEVVLLHEEIKKEVISECD